MNKYTIGVEGMRCPMCEKHAVEAIQKLGDVHGVKASHTEKTVVFTSKKTFEENVIFETIRACGYEPKSMKVDQVNFLGF